MGSTFKAFTVAMALEEGVATIHSRFDASEPLRVGNHTIRDYHAENRVMTVQEVFEHSSNIGAAKMAMEVGGERQRAFLRRIGLMDRAPGELPEIASPIVPSDANWREATIATVSFGHGMAVSPLATAAAFASIANGGNYVRPTFRVVPPGTPVEQTRVMSAGTAADVLRLMRAVVTEGTGTRAEAPGYMVAGKTGTAEKAVAGGYSSTRLLTSFAAVFPFDDPRYVVLILLDEPNPTPNTYGYRTAGWNAAPVAGRVVGRIAPMLGVDRREPSRPGPALRDPGMDAILASYSGDAG
jgi:cell division protein FtsI (penicillin-binding protein 3)